MGRSVKVLHKLIFCIRNYPSKLPLPSASLVGQGRAGTKQKKMKLGSELNECYDEGFVCILAKFGEVECLGLDHGDAHEL